MPNHTYWIGELEVEFGENQIKKYYKAMKRYGFVSYHNNDLYDICDCEVYGGEKLKGYED